MLLSFWTVSIEGLPVDWFLYPWLLLVVRLVDGGIVGQGLGLTLEDNSRCWGQTQ